MTLVFIRHGEASKGLGSDADRPLTEEGRAQAQAVASALAATGLRFARLYASPLVRAQQTAQALVEASLASSVETCDALLPERGAEPFLQLLASLPQSGAFAFVGHEPLLSELVERVLFGQVWGVVRMTKGAVAVLQRQESYWQLVGLASPEWFLPARPA